MGRTCEAPGGAYRPALDRAVVQLWMDRVSALKEGDPLLSAIVQSLSAAVDPEASMRRSAILAALADERHALRSLDQEHFVERIIDRDRYLSINNTLASRIDDLSRALLSIPAPVVDVGWLRDPDSLHEKWSKATVREGRDLLKLAILEVQVTRGQQGHRFVPAERLTVRWIA